MRLRSSYTARSISICPEPTISAPSHSPGAAEGQLGEWLTQRGQTNMLGRLKQLVPPLAVKNTGQTFTSKEINDDLNFVRDWLKHCKGDEQIEIEARADAFMMIERAVLNFGSIANRLTEPMLRFLASEAP